MVKSLVIFHSSKYVQHYSLPSTKLIWPQSWRKRRMTSGAFSFCEWAHLPVGKVRGHRNNWDHDYFNRMLAILGVVWLSLEQSTTWKDGQTKIGILVMEDCLCSALVAVSYPSEKFKCLEMSLMWSVKCLNGSCYCSKISVSSESYPIY